MGFLSIINNFKAAANRGNTVKELSDVQEELKELRKSISQPELENYCTSTTTFHNVAETAEFVKNAMLMNNTGSVYTNKVRNMDYSESKIFWTAMKKYCERMIIFTSERENAVAKVSALELKEKKLKKSLNIE